MTRLRLLLRNLHYFRAANLAVIAGMAIATAVLTGALLVGDSVRGSLRELAIQRLGPIDFALVAPRFFHESLAERLEADAMLAGEFDIAPAIVVQNTPHSSRIITGKPRALLVSTRSSARPQSKRAAVSARVTERAAMSSASA